jgi:Ser/Thr protein kinase RdoA (MazF antagonist)
MNNDTVAARFLPAALEALKAFPVKSTQVELVSLSENVTFRVTDCDTGAKYVLRLHRPGYQTLESLNSERVWTTDLAKVGIATQTPLRSNTGQHFHLVNIPEAGEQRYAGMTQWVEGTLLADHLGPGRSLEECRNCFRQIGGLAAKIHNQSSEWPTPAGFERPHYDIDGLLGEAPHWGRFWEHPSFTASEQALLLRTRGQIRDVLQTYPPTTTIYGLIHADLDPDNILVHEDRVTLIDFDDAGFGWHLYELAAVLISEIGEPDFPNICEALLAGYCEYRTLSERDLALLPMFVLIRGMAMIGWYGERPEIEASEYLDELKAAVLTRCAAFKPLSGNHRQ